MTGNKNAWRAPLAGLASLAMLATMGVAAGTAAAAGTATGPELTVKFDTNGRGSKTVADQKVSDHNYKVTVPTEYKNGQKESANSDMLFTGWYTSPTLGQGERVDFTEPVYAAGTVTLYAHWAKTGDTHKITLNGNNAATVPDLNQDGNKSNFTEMAVLAKADSKLPSWATPADKDVKDHRLASDSWNYSGKDYKAGDALPDGNATLKANSVASHIVAFKQGDVAASNPGSGPDDTQKNLSTNGTQIRPYTTGVAFAKDQIEVADGDTIPSGVNAWRNVSGVAHEVTRWNYAYQDAKGNKVYGPWDNSSSVTTDLTLFASYWNVNGTNEETPRVFNVNFLPDSKTFYPKSVDSVQVREGEGVTLPTINTFGDYYYVSAWKTAAGEDFNDGDAADATISNRANVIDLYFTLDKTARDEYTVTFDPNYTGSTTTKVTVKQGEYVNAPADPVRDGYVFMGWYASPEAKYQVNTVDLSQPASGDVYYFAGWLKDTKVVDLAKAAKLNNGNVDKVDNTTSYRTYTFTVGGETISQSAPIVSYGTGVAFTDASKKAFKTAYAEAQTKANLTKKESAAIEPDASLYEISLFTDEAKAESLTKDIQAAQAKLVAKDQASVYRVYDVNGSRKHLYTTNASEASNLIASGWRNEGISFKTTAKANENGAAVASGLYIPVYRLYDQPAKRHLYTTDQAEYDNLVNNLGWRDEGVAFYARTQGGEAVYRAYSPSRYEHLFTTNQTEYNNATNAKGEGWYRAEGIKFNVE